MARTVYYAPQGELFRIGPYSSSQVRQLLAAGRHDQVDAVEDEFFDEMVAELSRLLGRRLARPLRIARSSRPLRNDEEPTVVSVGPKGTLVVGYTSRTLAADEDGMIWLKRTFAGRLSFVLDPERRRGG